MNNEEMFLSKEGLGTFAKEMFSEMNTRITDRMVETVNENSDDDHVPTAAAVHDSLKNLKRIMTLVIADGDITKATITPDDKTTYVVRKTRTATEGVAYVWIEGVGFINLGTSASAGSGNDLGVITDDDIRSIVASASNTTKPSI